MNWIRHLTGLGVLLSMSSCGLLDSRSFLAEMTHEDDGFYSPGDFPVVGGDTARMFETREERLRRTPGSTEDLREEQIGRFLKDELRTLEARLSDDEVALYERYRSQLKTPSEKIYFLQLSEWERRNYLASRGLLREPNDSISEERYGAASDRVTLGMTKSEVEDSIGRPNRVEVAGNPRYENERWLYSVNGAMKYIYFESGRVEGWE